MTDHVISDGVGQRESNPGEGRFVLSGPDAVHDATRAAQAFAAYADLDHSDASHLCIIVEELVINLYDHGALGTADVVELTLAPIDGGIALTLTDPGQRFDPSLTDAGLPTPDRGGGAGLKLLRSWARDIDYRVINGRNRLTLLLPCRPRDK